MLKSKKTIALLLSTVVLAVIAIATAWILYQRSQEGAVAPTAPKSKPSAAQCVDELTFTLDTSSTQQATGGGSSQAASGGNTPTPTRTSTPTPTGVGGVPTNTPTPTGAGPTATATPTPSLAPGTTATPTPTRAPGTTATPTPTRGLARGGATATPTSSTVKTSTSSALPQAGFNLPSVLFLGAGALIVMLGILLLAL